MSKDTELEEYADLADLSEDTVTWIGSEELLHSKGTTKVEDLVKKALREELNKRKDIEKGDIKKESADVVPESTPVEIPLEPKEGFVAVSTLVGSVKKDFLVRKFSPEEYDEKIKGFIPAIRPGYVLQTEAACDILRSWELNDKTLVYGPTGSGKSTLVEQLCAHTNRPFIRVNASGDMDSSMIFGQLTAKEGSTHWVDGVATEAVRYGAVLAIDEWEVTPPEIMMGLQWLLEDNPRLFIKEMPGTSTDKFIVPNNRHRIVCMGNTQGQGDDTGQFAGTNVQNTATIDRFGTVVHLGYLPATHEIQMIQNQHSTIKKTAAQTLVKLANLIRQGYQQGQLSLTMSPRTLLNISNKVAFGLSWKEAVSINYINKLNESQQRVVEELAKKVYGEAWV